MANVRYQLTKDVYMPLDGQWQIVLSGTVFDDAPTVGYAPATVSVLSPGETPGALGAAGKATSVRGVRTR
jgi:hypothetical protein